MRYALLIHVDPEHEASEEESAEYMAIREADGVVDGAHLHPVDAATTVRVADDQTLVTDGPFADTKEFFGGYYILEADDLDRAIEVAARIPATRTGGGVEIRPIVEHPS